MKLNSLQEAISDYERITGETVDIDTYTEQSAGCLFNPKTNKYLKVLPSNEFIIWAIGEREGLSYFYFDQCYGFIKNFVPFVKDIMRIANLDTIVTATQRNINKKPLVHIRKWKMTWLSEYDFMFENRKYYVLMGDIENLK